MISPDDFLFAVDLDQDIVHVVRFSEERIPLTIVTHCDRDNSGLRPYVRKIDRP